MIWFSIKLVSMGSLNSSLIETETHMNVKVSKNCFLGSHNNRWTPFLINRRFTVWGSINQTLGLYRRNIKSGVSSFPSRYLHPDPLSWFRDVLVTTPFEKILTNLPSFYLVWSSNTSKDQGQLIPSVFIFSE